MKINTKYAIGALALLVAGFSQIAAAGNPNPGVIPIKSHSFGKSYAVWGQEFNNWVWQFTLAEFPLFEEGFIGDVDCGKGQTGNVWFLYGTLAEGVERNCTIPHGKALFISVNSVLSFVPLFGDNEQEIRDDAKRDLDGTDTTIGVQTLEVEIDGVMLKDPFGYRASSPAGGFVFTVQDGSVLTDFGIPAGDYDPAIVDGYWVMLPPLSAGEHVIKWSSSGQNQFGEFYAYSVTWNLYVDN